MPGRVLQVLVLLGICLSSNAHTPHHVVDKLALSPNYASDSTVFALVHNALLISENRAASWRQLSTGIDTPYVLTDIAVSHDFGADNVVLVSSDGGGVFLSSDRGQRWSRFSGGLPHNNIGKLFLARVEDTQLLLAAGSERGLFASHVDTADWRRVISDDVQVTAFFQPTSKAMSYGLAGDSTGGIWKSADGLSDWRRIVHLENVGAVTALAAGPGSSWMVGTERSGLLVLSDGGQLLGRLSDTWPDVTETCSGDQRETPVSDVHVRDIETMRDGASVFVTTWNSAVHVSHDGGRSWQMSGGTPSCNDQADAVGFGTPHFRDLEIGGGETGDWLLASFEGLFRSEDKGKSWVALETMPVSLIRGMAVSPTSGDQHALIITTYGGGAYITLDQGRSWTIANHGLVTTRLADAEFTPGTNADFPVFALTRQMLLSRDGVEDNWVARSLAYKGWRRTAASFLRDYLLVNPDTASNLFLDELERRSAWPMQIALSPSFGEDQTLLIGFRRQGVWISTNGGARWDRDWDGPTDYVTDLVLSPNFPQDRTAFAAVRGAGILVTRDAADSWQVVNKGFDFLASTERTQSPNHFIDPPLSRALTDAVLAVSPEYAADSTLFAGSAAGLFRSADGGESWEERLRGAIAGLAISPAFESDEIILTSVRGRGLYWSRNAGETFEQTGVGLLADSVELRYIEFSPSFATDKVVYGASERDVFVSRDQGITWHKVERPVRYEDRRGSDPGPVWFSGEWEVETGSRFSASTQTTSHRPGDMASLHFVGNSVTWYGERGPSGGMARIVIDDSEVAIADLFSHEVSTGDVLFKFVDLADAPHEIRIEVLDRKNAASTGRRVSVDNIDVSRY